MLQQFISHAFISLALWVAAPALKEKPAGTEAEAKQADTLRTLRIIIKNEMKDRNKVLILKDKDLSDSLVHYRFVPGRATFDQLIGDSTLAQEVKTQEEFRKYWARVEEQNGLEALRAQYKAHDIDKSAIPKAYLFDSSVVIYPGWIILRKK